MVGELRYQFDLHYQVWYLCVKHSNNSIFTVENPGENIVILMIFKDVLMC